MKLRVHRNSLRLRLNRSDVEQLRKAGICAEVLRFGPDSQFTYTLETSADVTTLRAQYRQNCIRVLIPLDTVQQWADSDQISLSQSASDSGPSLLIEKDFQCLHCSGRAPSEDAESFPNPIAVDHENAKLNKSVHSASAS